MHKNTREGKGLRDDSGQSHPHKHTLIRGVQAQGFKLLTRKAVGLREGKLFTHREPFLEEGNPTQGKYI